MVAEHSINFKEKL